MKKMRGRKTLAGILIALGMMFTAPLAAAPKEVNAATLPVGEGSRFVFNKTVKNASNSDNYYTMTVKKSGYLKYHSITGSRINEFEIRDADDNQICYWGGYYVTVAEGNKVYLRAGKYSVRITVSRYQSDTESVFYWTDANETFRESNTHNNDTEDTPTVLRSLTGAKWIGETAEGDEYDYYQFTMKSKGTLILGLGEKTKNIKPDFVIYKKDGTVVTDSKQTTRTGEKYRISLNKGTYRIRISSANHGIYTFSMKAKYAPVYKWKKTSAGMKYVNQYGKAATGWNRISGKWYYFKKSGVMVTGKCRIGKKTYRFSSKGICLNP